MRKHSHLIDAAPLFLYKKLREGNTTYDSQIFNTEKRIEQLQKYIDNFDNISTNADEFAKMRQTLGDVTTTDDIAAYLPKTNLNNITLQNVIDGGLGDVTIVNNRVGNYLKSLRGNNGMFDMTNPNIYKSILPATLGIGAASQMQEEETPRSTKICKPYGGTDDCVDSFVMSCYFFLEPQKKGFKVYDLDEY